MNQIEIPQYRVIFSSILGAQTFRGAIRNREIQNTFLARTEIPMGQTNAERACEVVLGTALSQPFLQRYVSATCQRHGIAAPRVFRVYEDMIGGPITTPAPHTIQARN